MKPPLAASALLVLATIAFSPIKDLKKTQELPNVLPADAKVEQLALTNDAQRTYYTTATGDIWLYDRGIKMSSRVVTGPVAERAGYDRGRKPDADNIVIS